MNNTQVNKERSMNSRTSSLLGAILALLLSNATFSEAQVMNDELSLTVKQQSIVPIAAFAANRRYGKAETSLE